MDIKYVSLSAFDSYEKGSKLERTRTLGHVTEKNSFFKRYQIGINHIWIQTVCSSRHHRIYCVLHRMSNLHRGNEFIPSIINIM